MPPGTPTPLSMTLRFKSHTTTVLLYAQPTDSFTAIKTALLTALHARNPSGAFHDAVIPTSPDQVMLGRPRDPKDLSQGFTTLEIPEGEPENGARGRKMGGQKSVLDCPQGVGLKDGAVLAFKFTDLNDENEDGEDEEDELANAEIEGTWEVSLPSYEEEYGSQAAGLQP
ncbi:MAG: hypothetical protein M1817_003354 [Caeruleum heppii]|nr:MAG: hypothetical protein M1817_003354 [Caeruleum heppii]